MMKIENNQSNTYQILRFRGFNHHGQRVDSRNHGTVKRWMIDFWGNIASQGRTEDSYGTEGQPWAPLFRPRAYRRHKLDVAQLLQSVRHARIMRWPHKWTSD